MDASLPAGPGQTSATSEVAGDNTTVSARQFYQNDLLLVVLKDRLRLNDFQVIAGISGLVIIILFGLYALAGMPGASQGYFVRAIAQAFLVMPALAWIYLKLPDNIASLFNSLETNNVIGHPRSDNSRITAYSDFLSELITSVDNFWWVAGAMTFAGLYWLYRLLILNPLIQSTYPLWLQLANLVIYAPMLYSVLLTIIRLLVTLFYTGRLFQSFEIRVNPLHPDGSAGLGFLENMLRVSVYLTLFTGLGALALNPAFLGTNVNVFSTVEAVIIGLVYGGMSLTFFIGWLVVPHQAMVDARNAVLQSLATDFQLAVIETTPSVDADVKTIKEGTDRLSEINRRYKLLQSTYPTWPLEIVQVRRLIGAASLPAIITLLWPFISVLIPTLLASLNNLLKLVQR